jgi:hypothetical protein
MSLFPKKEPQLPDIPLREYLERVIDERGEQYKQQFRAAEIAVAAAFNAQKELTNAAFLSSREAIGKAEEAQKAYNEVHNDIGRQMDKQAEGMLPRPEALGMFKASDEKLNVMQVNYDGKLEALRLAIEKNADIHVKAEVELRLSLARLLTVDAYELRHAELQRQVTDLRESRSEVSGSKTGIRELWVYVVGGISILSVIVSIVFHFIP